MSAILRQGQRVLDIEAQALLDLKKRINGDFEKAVNIILACKGKVVITGIGKSGHIARKIASTMSSTGTPAIYLHPAESSHGDLGMISGEDMVLAISYGGETAELLPILNYVVRRNLPLVGFSGKADSSLAKAASVFIDISVKEEACPLGLAPTASSTATLAMGDALAMAVMEAKGFKPESFGELHPGGSLGARLTRVGDLMHRGEALPFVKQNTSVKEVLTAMTHREVRGAAGVLDEQGNLVGVIMDGDIRRCLERSQDPFAGTAQDLMKRNPYTIDANELAEKALFMMEQFKIQMLIVLDQNSPQPRHPVGMINIQDLFKAKIR